MLAPYHLGSLHPVEQVLTIVLALGPFVVLGLVIVLVRRRDRLEEEREGPRDDEQGSQRDR